MIQADHVKEPDIRLLVGVDFRVEENFQDFGRFQPSHPKRSGNPKQGPTNTTVHLKLVKIGGGACL